MPTISILTPFRNASGFIRETAASIFQQSFQDWEWILINDHSEEEEENHLEDYLNDPRVKLISANGKGITDALITGFAMAAGEFVTRMDADDIMPEQKLKSFIDQFRNNGVDIITGKVQYFSANGEISPGYKNYEAWLNERVVLQDFYQEIYRECTLASGNWMMRTDCLRQIGGFTGLVYPEDYDLLFRWYENDLKIHGIDEVTHLWREHPARTSRTSKDYSQERFFDLKIRCFIEQDMKDGPLILNGTGAKGRLTAKILIEKDIPFHWVSVEPEKFGAGVYGMKIYGSSEIRDLHSIQILNATSIGTSEVMKLYEWGNEISRVIEL
jgi:glycosyltransferase involved in cell wall biosynthesis